MNFEMTKEPQVNTPENTVVTVDIVKKDRELALTTVGNGLLATKVNMKEQMIASGEMQLLKKRANLLLTIHKIVVTKK